MEVLIRCINCNGPLEIDSEGRYTNMVGDYFCAYAPKSSYEAKHVVSE